METKLPLHVSLSYYKRRDVQEAMVKLGADREVAVRYDTFFGKRPDTLSNAADIMELAKQKATSFHCSEERWKNPLQLNPNMKRHDLNNNRLGWDLVIDIDCGIFEYSRIATDLVIKAFKFYDIKSISCKFSGNKGFHIAIPFEAFPEMINNKRTADLFPEAAKDIALYLREMIKKPLGEQIMKFEGDFEKIVAKTGSKPKDITYKIKDEFGNDAMALNAEPFLNIDTILISSRHLFRMVYSLHEKSGLVSIPIDPKKVLQFERLDASPEKVVVSETLVFLDRNNIRKGEASQLLSQALDFSIKEETSEFKQKREYADVDAIPEELFPPCIQLIKKGIGDGKKRALFILVNFLTSVGWNYEQIEEYLKQWNKNNPEPIRETLLVGQVRYHKSQRKKVLPPNCDNQMYYVDIGVCKPDNLCAKIKNPVSYAHRKAFYLQQESKGKKKPVKEGKKAGEKVVDGKKSEDA